MDGSASAIDLGNWATSDLRVALVGDSTLDNVLWVEGKACIPELLAKQVPCAVRNLAADGFNSTDTLRGSRQVISVGMRQSVGDPVDFSDDGIFRPLERLVLLDPPPTHVVLSVGGNDVREILGNMAKLPDILTGFQHNYPSIVEACLKVKPTPTLILMWQYRPSLSEDGHYGVYRAIGALPGPASAVEKLNKLMEAFYNPILELARKHRLPIVDLPRTFDIHDPELYSCQIEPSAKGGAVITSLLKHVLLQHSSPAGGTDGAPSTFYRLTPCADDTGKPEIVEELNDGGMWAIER